MSRNLGVKNYASNFEVLRNAPLDSRQLVAKYSDLILDETWGNKEDQNKYVYIGMTVSCQDRPGELFQLIGDDYKNVSNWKSISAGITNVTTSNVTRTADDIKAITAEGALHELASSIKTVKEEAESYKVVKITDQATINDANIRELYKITHKVDGEEKDLDVKIPVYANSSIKDISTSGTKIIFTYTGADGSDKTEEVDISALITSTSAGNGLSSDGKGVLSVKLDGTGDGKFLSVSASGLKLDGVTDAIKSAKIKVLGKTGDAHIEVTADSAETPTSYTISTKGIASSDELSAVSGKVDTNAKNITSLTTKVETNTGSINILNGEASEDGSVKKAVKEALDSSKSYTDTEIGKLSFTSKNITRDELPQSDSNVGVSGTTVEEAIKSIAQTLKTVHTEDSSYNVVKIESGLGANVQEAYQLQKTVNGGTTNVGVPIPVYKSSALKEIKAVTKAEDGKNVDYLRFTYIDNSGAEKYSDIKMSDLIASAQYTFTNGVQCVGTTVSILLDNSDSNTNYLSTSEKGLKLSGISTDIAKSKTEVVGGNGISIDKPTEASDGHAKYTINLKLSSKDGQMLTLDTDGSLFLSNTLDAGVY